MMNVLHLNPSQLQIECYVRGFDGAPEDRLEWLHEQILSEAKKEVDPPNRPHATARKNPKIEVKICYNELIRLKEELRSRVNSISELGLRRLYSQMCHIQSRLYRMRYSKCVRDVVPRLEQDTLALMGTIDKCLLNNANETSQVTPELIDELNITTVEDSSDSDEDEFSPTTQVTSSPIPCTLRQSLPPTIPPPPTSSIVSSVANLQPTPIYTSTGPSHCFLPSNPYPIYNYGMIARPSTYLNPSAPPRSQTPQVSHPYPYYNLPPANLTYSNAHGPHSLMDPNTASATTIRPTTSNPRSQSIDELFTNQVAVSTAPKDPPNRPSFGRRNNNLNLSFDGSRNGLTYEKFIFRAEKLAKSFGIPDHHLVDELHFVLKGQAAEFYWAILEKHKGNITWNQLKQEMHERYRDRRSDFDIRRSLDVRRQRRAEPFLDFYSNVVEMSLSLRTPITQDDLLMLLMRNMSIDLQSKLAGEEFLTVDWLVNKCVAIEDTWSRVEKLSPSVRRVEQLDMVTPDETQESNPAYVDALRLPKAPNPNPRFTSNDPNCLIICWNCQDMGHAYTDCPSEQRSLFCYGCGTPNMIKPKCPTCLTKSGNLPETKSPGSPRLLKPLPKMPDPAPFFQLEPSYRPNLS